MNKIFGGNATMHRQVLKRLKSRIALATYKAPKGVAVRARKWQKDARASFALSHKRRSVRCFKVYARQPPAD